MYQKNSQTIIDRSPEKMSDHASLFSDLNKSGIPYKGSRFYITAFLLLTLTFIGCESPGSVGEGLEPDGADVVTEQYSIDNLTSMEANTFSGKLQNSATGNVDDPVYGSFNAIALLKPSLSSAQTDTIQDDDTMTLRMIFNSDLYGDETSVADFEIYEIGELWRGNEIKYNEEVTVDYSSLVAEFQVADSDTVEVELSSEWVDKYRAYFNSDAANRDSLYSREFTGLAVVPSGDNNQVRFLRHTEVDEDNPDVTEFRVHPPEPVGDEEEEEEAVIGLLDWGSSVTLGNVPDNPDGIVLRNMDQILKTEFQLPVDELKSKNIVNASLVFNVDRSGESMSTIVRPEIETIRAHTFATTPSDLVSELFINAPRFGADLNKEEDLFKVDLTQYVLNQVYGDAEEGPLYFSVQTVNGLFYTVTLHGETAPDTLKPRLIITSVE